MSEHAPIRPQPRFSVTEKAVHVSHLLRLGGGDRPMTAVIRQYADQIGVRERTLYRWLADDNLRQEQPAASEREGRFKCDTAMVTVVAQEQNLRDAYDKLRAAGIVEVGYSTFCRAFDRVDPAVKHGALSGRKAMAENRIYLKKFSPHRCYAYHLDHTEADVWVLPNHRHSRPIRPKLTVIIDAYSGYLWAFVWYRQPDGQAVAAALASVCVEEEVDGVSVGGIPQQVILDNAAAHFNEDMRRACTAMGVVMSPTSAYSSWQNGVAERAINLVNTRVSKTAPGSIRAGSNRSSDRFLESERAKTDPANFWSAAAFEREVRRVVHHLNTQAPRRDRGGLTRLQLFDQDPTDRLFLSPEAARMACMATEKDFHRSSKNGIQFKNRSYVCAELFPGRSYQVRYLPGRTDFIEVFDETGVHIGRAYNQETLSKTERDRILATRARQERDVAAIEEGLRQHRVHQAALDNSVDQTSDQPEDAEASVVELHPARNPEVDKAPKRKKMPRVPAPQEDGDAQTSEKARLHRQQIVDSPFGQEVAALVSQMNADRAAGKKGGPDDEH